MSKKTKPVTETITEPVAEPVKKWKNDNLKKFNALPAHLKKVGRRQKPSRTVQIYVRQYLNSDTGVRDFQRWAKAKPGEAIPWAWKVTYGDGSGMAATKGQINVLIQVLTGQSQPLSAQPTPAQLAVAAAVDSQVSDSQISDK